MKKRAFNVNRCTPGQSSEAGAQTVDDYMTLSTQTAGQPPQNDVIRLDQPANSAHYQNVDNSDPAAGYEGLGVRGQEPHYDVVQQPDESSARHSYENLAAAPAAVAETDG